MYYLDTSAALKLVKRETHSTAFTAFWITHQDGPWVSSALLQVELARAARRVSNRAARIAEQLLDGIDLIAISQNVIEQAVHEPSPLLRSLDAIHLASARLVADELTGIVTYDERLADAAGAAGMTVVAPSA